MEEKAELRYILVQALYKIVQLKFEYLLDELRKQILEANIHFGICEDLWPTQQRVKTINRYRGYFIPARSAHFNQFTIKISEIFSNRLTAPSLYNIFKMLKINPTLAPGIEVPRMAKKLRQHKKTKEAIIEYRNRSAAHYDVTMRLIGEISTNKESVKRKPILFGDTTNMLNDIQEIFNDISGAHSRNLWSFKPLEHNHTNYILDELEAYYKLDL